MECQFVRKKRLGWRYSAGRPHNVPVIRPTGRLTSSLSGSSQRYSFNAHPDPNHNAKPTNPTLPNLLFYY